MRFSAALDSVTLATTTAHMPNVNDRKNDPAVDGAITRNGSTACDAPARRRSVSSMQRPPTSIDATKVNTLRPDPEPASRPSRRTVSSISASKPSLCITVPASNNPASATSEASSNTALIPSIPPATLLTGSASSHGQNEPLLTTTFSHVRRPFWWTRHTHEPHRVGGFRLSGCSQTSHRAADVLPGRTPDDAIAHLEPAQYPVRFSAAEGLRAPDAPAGWVLPVLQI